MNISSVIRSVISPTTESSGAAPTNVLDLSPLRLLKRQAEDALAELTKLDTIARESQAVIDEVLADGKIEDEKEQSKLMHARLRLDLIPSRRKRLLTELPKLSAGLASAITESAGRWNQAVRAARERAWNHIVETNSPFFAGVPRKKIERDLDRVFWPKLEAFRKANFGSFAGEARGDLAALVSMAESLISLATRHNRSLEIGLEIK